MYTTRFGYSTCTIAVIRLSIYLPTNDCLFSSTFFFFRVQTRVPQTVQSKKTKRSSLLEPGNSDTSCLITGECPLLRVKQHEACCNALTCICPNQHGLRSIIFWYKLILQDFLHCFRIDITSLSLCFLRFSFNGVSFPASKTACIHFNEEMLAFY